MLMNLCGTHLLNLQKFIYNPSLLQNFIKPKISQSLTLSHVATLSTKQNTENSQILWDIMRVAKTIFPFKEQCCLQQLCYKLAYQSLFTSI